MVDRYTSKSDTNLLRQIHPNTSDQDWQLLQSSRITDVLLPLPQAPNKTDALLSGLPKQFKSHRQFSENQNRILKSRFDRTTLKTTILSKSFEHQHLTEELSQYFDDISKNENQTPESDFSTPIGSGGYGKVFAIRLKKADNAPAVNSDNQNFSSIETTNETDLVVPEFALKLFQRPGPEDTLHIDELYHSYPTVTQRSFQEEREALKIISEQTSFDDVRLRDIKENHIIEFIASFTTPQVFGLILLPIALCDLGEIIRACGPGSGLEVRGRLFHRNTVNGWFCEAFGCLASALFVLKSQGIRHEQIKPKNILMECYADTQGLEHVKFLICDFATAHICPPRGNDFSENESIGEQRVQTPHYTTPQRILNDRRSYPDDMFTLGLIYLELVTIIHGSELSKLEGFVKRTWEQDPKRPETVEEDLQQFYEDNLDYIPVLGSHCTSATLQTWLHEIRPSALNGSDVMAEWVENLLSRNSDNRWDAKTLVEKIQRSNDSKFWAHCCNDLYMLPGAVKAACRTLFDEVLFKELATSYEWKRTVNKHDEQIARPDSRNGGECIVGIIQTSLLERRLVLVEEWSYPQVFRIDVWLSIAGLELTHERGSSSVGLRWSDYCQLRMKSDSKNRFHFWRGVDYDNVNNELQLHFSSPNNAEQLVDNLFPMPDITHRSSKSNGSPVPGPSTDSDRSPDPERSPEEIQVTKALKIMFVKWKPQMIDREYHKTGSHFMVAIRSSPDSRSEETSLSRSIRLFTYEDDELHSLGDDKRGLDVFFSEKGIRIYGLGSIEYTASKKRYRTAPALPNVDELPDITIQDGSLMIPHGIQRPLYICNDSRYPSLLGSDLQSLCRILEELTQWKVWFLCTVPKIERVRPVRNENLGHGFLILWKKPAEKATESSIGKPAVTDHQCFSFRLEDKTKTTEKQKWRYGRVVRISTPRRTSKLYKLQASHCGKKGTLDARAFVSASNSSETFQFDLSKAPQRLDSFLIEERWVPNELQNTTRIPHHESSEEGDFDASAKHKIRTEVNEDAANDHTGSNQQASDPETSLRNRTDDNLDSLEVLSEIAESDLGIEVSNLIIPNDLRTANLQAFDLQLASQHQTDVDSDDSEFGEAESVFSVSTTQSSQTSHASVDDPVIARLIAEFLLDDAGIGSLLDESAAKVLANLDRVQTNMRRLLKLYGRELSQLAQPGSQRTVAKFVNRMSGEIAQAIRQRLEQRQGGNTLKAIENSSPRSPVAEKQRLLRLYLRNQIPNTTPYKRLVTESEPNIGNETQKEPNDANKADEPQGVPPDRIEDKSEDEAGDDMDGEDDSEIRKLFEDDILEAKQFLRTDPPLSDLIRKLKKYIHPHESSVTMPEAAQGIPIVEPGQPNETITSTAQFPQSAFPNLPSLVDKIFNAVMPSITEPLVPEGMQRVRWICHHCGTNLFDDFETTNPVAIHFLETQLQANNPVHYGRVDKVKRVAAEIGNELGKFISSKIHQALSLSQHSTHQLPVHNATATQPAGLQATRDELRLLLCLDVGRFETKLLQPQIQHVKDDRTLFEYLRQVYYENQKPRTWFTVRSVTALYIRRFTLDYSNYPDTHIHEEQCPSSVDCICLPPVAIVGSGPGKEYRCAPAPETPKPLPGHRYMSHVFACPNTVKSGQKTILQQLPKRTIGTLSALPDQAVMGWGLHVEQGLHLLTIKVLVALFSLSSAAFGITWSLIRGEMGDAFAASGWWMALGAGFISYLALRSKL